MSDNITLPREVVKFVLQHLEWWSDDEPQEKEAIEALRAALAAPKQKHPGYVIGSHWLETAYSRICAGEAEADVLRDCGWERVDQALRRENERLREALQDIARQPEGDEDSAQAVAKAALRREEA